MGGAAVEVEGPTGLTIKDEGADPTAIAGGSKVEDDVAAETVGVSVAETAENDGVEEDDTMAANEAVGGFAAAPKGCFPSALIFSMPSWRY